LLSTTFTSRNTKEQTVSPIRKYRVLYVEDHEDTVELVSLVLQERGFEVTATSTVANALRLAREQTFDLYLLDAWLEDGWGVDLCRQLRRIDKTTPIVFYSAAAYDVDRAAAFSSGAQEYVCKPTSVADLSRVLSRLVNPSMKARVANGSR
jgi:DNA-binding response OmpR family regulator